MVHEDDLRDYAHAELAGGRPREGEASESSPPERVSASAVVEISGWNPEEASRLSNHLIAMLNGKDESRGRTRFDFSYDPAAARWLEALLDGLGIERAAFLGMSLGSWYALSLATNNPRRVRALSLVTAGGIAPQKRGFLAKAILCMMLGERGRRRLAGLVYRKAEVPPVVHEFQALVSAHFRPLLEPLPIFRDGDLRGLKMPLQYFGGDLDVILDTAKTVRRLRALVPHAEVRVLPGTGHVILDKFGEVREFLERN